MYGIYTNIGGTLMGSMLPYIAAPWILWVLMDNLWKSMRFPCGKKDTPNDLPWDPWDYHLIIYVLPIISPSSKRGVLMGF